MTIEAVRKLVEREVEGDWTLTNAHGCDLRRCLIAPELREYDNCGVGCQSALIWLWLVFEESPEDRSGYKIVYGEEAGKFGLAVPGNGRDVFIGYYGSFLDTYRSM